MLLKKMDTWLSLVFFALGIVIYVTAAGYDDIPSQFPILLAFSFGVLSLMLFGVTLVKHEKAKDISFTGGHYAMPILVTLVMCLYAAALEYAGFIIPSVLLMLCVGWILGYRRARLVLVGVLFVLAVYGVFGQLLGVPLPELPFME